MVYVLDTNIIIHYLRGEPNVYRNLRNAITTGHELVIPRVVDYEIRRGFLIQPAPKKESMYNILIEPTGYCTLRDMGEYFWTWSAKIYADLYLKRFTVGEIDIIIAAFCLENDYVLVTNNTSDFKNISNLKIVDWTQQIP